MSQYSIAKSHNERKETKSTCLLVYSTREDHVTKVIERTTDFLSNDLHFGIIKLDEVRIAGTQLLPTILKYTKECDVAIVILDGLRPNVVLELGMILANGTPCIILVERAARINIKSLIVDTGRQARSLPQVRIDVAKHISDISNISWNEYSLQADTDFRSLVRDEIRKLRPRIEKRISHDHEKYASRVISLLRKVENSTKLSAEKYGQIISKARREARMLSKEQGCHIFFHIAQSFLLRGKLQTALRETVRGLNLDAKHGPLLGLKGKILFMLGQQSEGLKILKRAFLRSPRNKYLQIQYLQSLAEARKPKAILKHLSHIPYESLLIRGLVPIKADALFLDGQIASSLELLLEMYEYDLNVWSIHHVMYLLHSEPHEVLPNGLVMRIEKNIQYAVSRKHIRCYKCFTLGCKAIGLTNFAKRFSSVLIKKSKPKDPDSLNEFAFLFIELGEYKKAEAILRTAIRRFSNHSYLNATWGLYKFRVDKHLSSGKRFYSKAIELSPGDMRLRRMYFYQLARFFLRRDDITQAKVNYAHALKVHTDFKQTEIQRELVALRKSRGSIKS